MKKEVPADFYHHMTNYVLLLIDAQRKMRRKDWWKLNPAIQRVYDQYPTVKKAVQEIKKRNREDGQY